MADPSDIDIEALGALPTPRKALPTPRGALPTLLCGGAVKSVFPQGAKVKEPMTEGQDEQDWDVELGTDRATTGGEEVEDIEEVVEVKEVRAARKLYTKFNLEAVRGDLGEDALGKLAEATFRDERWGNAVRHIKESEGWGLEQAQDLLRKGAQAYGFWHLPAEVLQSLAQHLLSQEAITTPALDAWIEQVQSGRSECRDSVALGERRLRTSSVTSADVKGYAADTIESRSAKRMKCVTLFVVFVLSNLYALEVVLIMYPGIVHLFGIPIYFARAGGAGTLLWTSLLFLSMSRTLHKAIARYVSYKSWIYKVLEQQKELHIFCGQMLIATALLHVFSHCVGTLPGLASHSVEELNGILGCANPDDTPGYIGGSISWLSLTNCPLTERPTYMGILLRSTPGLSGVALLLVSILIGFTAHLQMRKLNFEFFMYVHQVSAPLWLILLFVHGSKGWVGIGFPLVVFFCTIPALLYAVDRVLRLLRYYLFAGTAVRVVDVVIRPGPNDKAKGSLINLRLSKPPYLWRFQEGMYAFLNMPGYAQYQWHPFTISSARQDETVDFIVTACGDWTSELAERCLQAYRTQSELPMLALDGPYLAPTVSALSHEVLIVVGAGVGITPFLSLLGNEETLHNITEAHFFWMARSADEFLFGRKQFTRIVSHLNLRDKVFLHLHVTQRDLDTDVAAYMFRESVRRQSRVDRAAFHCAAKGLAPCELVSGAQLPWCWVHESKEDVLWVRALLEGSDRHDDELLAAHEDHWALGVRSKSGGDSTARGLFQRSTCSPTAATLAASRALAVGMNDSSAFLPVVFGRPNFAREVRAIGKARPAQDVHVYVCGNDALVQSLQAVCTACNDSARSEAQEGRRQPQKYKMHFERFG
jgi:predicted ferric reductase